MWEQLGDSVWGGMGLGMFLFWGVLIAACLIMLVRALDARDRRRRANDEREEFEQKRRDPEQ